MNTLSSINTIYEFTEKPGRQLLRELILYIADKCRDDEKFGATKLNKILYFSDFVSYLKYGEPITGVCYQHLANGPAPEMLVPVRKEMEDNHEIVVRSQAYYNHSQKRIIALRDANLEGFKPRDIALVDSVIDDLHRNNASEVSEMSHGLAWQATRQGEKIPYNYVFLSNEGITALDIALTQELLREMNEESTLCV